MNGDPGSEAWGAGTRPGHDASSGTSTREGPPSRRGGPAPRLKTVAERLEKKRFLFVTGKGGVGKTTVCGALALALARRGKRVLVAMCNAKERLSAILGTRPIGHDLTEATPGVWAVNILPERALEEYGAIVLKSQTVANLVFDNKYVKAFFRAVPGLYEWSMLGKAWFHTTEHVTDHARFDIVIFDAPATGHGLDMLRVPKVILDVVPPGVLRKDAERAWAMFQDPTQSGVVVVTLPEEMPVVETLELVSAVKTELKLPVLELIVNSVLPTLFHATEREELLKDPDLLEIVPQPSEHTAGTLAIVAGARRAVRERVQSESLERLFAAFAQSEISLSQLPFLFDEASTQQGTRLLAKHLGG